MNIRKIMIFGCPGSGKSTLTKQLSKKLQIPSYHVDKYFYTNNWQERPTQDFFDDVCAIAAQDSYIIDGNCARMMLERDMVAPDIVIFLEVPLWKCYWRVIKRRFTKDTSIDDRAPDCEERLSLQFLQKMWGYKDKVEARLEKCKIKYPSTTFVRVTNNDELQALEAMLRK